MNVTKSSRAYFSGAIILAIGIFTYVISSKFPGLPEGHPGPGLFPRIIGGLLTMTGVALMVVRSEGERAISLSGNWVSVFLLMAIVISYPWIHRAGGFLIALALSVFGVALLMRIIWWKSLVIAVLTTASIYLLFKQLLQVPL